ncbi:hypothetical protein [Pseudomonas aestiva]|uniref:hypothetical protein n=1 Tax=Pseudomonas aestiva TaxID=3136739 RepID=UPI0032662BDD
MDFRGFLVLLFAATDAVARGHGSSSGNFRGPLVIAGLCVAAWLGWKALIWGLVLLNRLLIRLNIIK